VPLVEAIENNLGRKPEQASADSGYCSEPNLKALVARGIDVSARVYGRGARILSTTNLRSSGRSIWTVPTHITML
jgi:hypothetical protein